MNDKFTTSLVLPRRVYEAIKRLAERENRSINKQMVFLLEKGVRGEKSQ